MCIYIAGQTFWPNARCQNYTRKHNHTHSHSHSHTHSTHMYAKQLARSLLVAGCVLFKILRHVNIKGPALSGSVPFGCEPPPPESEPSRVVPCVLGSRCCITPFDLSPTVRVCVRVCMYTHMAYCVSVCVCASWDPLRVLTGPFGHISPTIISLMPWLSSPPLPLALPPTPTQSSKRNICKCCFPLGCYYFKFFAYACFAVLLLLLPPHHLVFSPDLLRFFSFISLTFYQLSLPVSIRSIQLTCR